MGSNFTFQIILSFPNVYLVGKRPISHLEIKPLLDQLASRIKPLDHCNQIFLTLNAVKNPTEEQQKSLRKPLLSHLSSVHTHRYSSTSITQKRTCCLYLVKVYIKVVYVGKFTCIILPLSLQGLHCPYRYSIQKELGGLLVCFFSGLVYIILKVEQIKPGKGSSN